MNEFSIARLSLGPNDVLVVRANARLTQDSANRLAEQIRASVPKEQKMLVIDSSLELSVLTRSEIEGRLQ